MPSYPLPTLAYQITPTGASAPSLEDIIGSLNATAQNIFGEDIYITPDAQDEQLLAAVSQAIFDTNASGIAGYLSFSPATAVGAALSSNVKINGIQRDPLSYSTAILTLVGTAYTVLLNCLVQDQQNNLWALPSLVTIPESGTIDVTATCQTPGAIIALENTINVPYTTVLGWDSATNPAAATIGAPVEEDGDLRQKQTISTAISSRTQLEAIQGAIANILGVQRSKVYQNDTGTPDGNGIPGHTISVVVSGGDSTAIAQAIEQQKDGGCGTYGSTAVVVDDPEGLPITIRFYELAETPIYAAITIQPLAGYVSSTETALVAALVAFINALAIGENVYQFWCAAAAGLADTPLQQTFVITHCYIGLAANPSTNGDVTIAFNAAASCATGNVAVTVL
jgi:hypothetical protein